LDSPTLEELIHPSKQSGTHKPKAHSDGVQAGRPDDWSIDEFLK
jgi:hypothetical protein